MEDEGGEHGWLRFFSKNRSTFFFEKNQLEAQQSKNINSTRVDSMGHDANTPEAIRASLLSIGSIALLVPYGLVILLLSVLFLCIS